MNGIKSKILLGLIAKNLSTYIKILLFIIIINISYFLIKTPSYTSNISFYSSYKDIQEASLFNPLSSLMGNVGTLSFSISDYVKSDKILQELVEKEYIINGEKVTLIDYWGSDFVNFYDFNPLSLILKINKHSSLNSTASKLDKKTFFAKEKLRSKIDFSENRITSIYNISISIGKHPYLSKQIVENAYYSILKYVSEIENLKASEKINFINGRLNQVNSDLQKAENEKLIFLQKNTRPFSPSLILKEQRIQRKIDLHFDVYSNLSNQLELAKINQKDDTSSIFVLDKASLAIEKDGRSLLMSMFISAILSFILYSAFLFFRNINLLNNNE